MISELFAVSSILHYLAGISMFLVSLFLILLVLVQRGRGGGLSGAFGGMGGQSAFGSKAGDVFTRITVVTAGFWILLCILWIFLLNRESTPFGPTTGGNSGQLSPLEPDEDDSNKEPSTSGGLQSPDSSPKEDSSDSN